MTPRSSDSLARLFVSALALFMCMEAGGAGGRLDVAATFPGVKPGDKKPSKIATIEIKGPQGQPGAFVNYELQPAQPSQPATAAARYLGPNGESFVVLGDKAILEFQDGRSFACQGR